MFMGSSEACVAGDDTIEIDTEYGLMLFRRTLAVSLLVVGCLTSINAGERREFPQPEGWVNDFANVITASAKRHLATLCLELDHKTHAQIAIVTIDSLAGAPIDEYAQSLFNKWGIGHKEDNRGILILLSIADRKYRIEVGRGFEPLFPNERIAKIGAEMIPDLKNQDYSKALLRATDGIALIIANERGVTLHPSAQRPIFGVWPAFLRYILRT
jgi:uncharacterized protein